jgi:hypothetical protein
MKKTEKSLELVWQPVEVNPILKKGRPGRPPGELDRRPMQMNQVIVLKELRGSGFPGRNDTISVLLSDGRLLLSL